MKFYNEIKQIAILNEMQTDLINKLASDEFDTDGFDFRSAYFIKKCVEENGHLYSADGRILDNAGLVNEDYYCCQHQGYIEDDFYGTLYFATDEDGLFIAIPFSV